MSGKLRVETAPVDLNAIVRRARDVIQPAADAKRIRVMVEGDGLPVIVEGDDARLQQVTWNLLTNAVKFTPEGGTIRARVRRMNESAELSVIDTGHGISQGFLPAVFEPFRQADGSATRAHGGLGLGLTIVKHIVEAHGGTVRADSAGAGMGATFTIRVPLAAGADVRSDLGAHSMMAPAVAAESQPSLEGLSVLVVDDDDQSRQVMAAHLESHRAVVLTATSAAEAFEVLQREHPDVLLADVAMPGEDGYSLIRKLRAMAPAQAAAIPAVAVTAFARDEDRREALRAGFQLHLVKPIEPRSLVAAVARIGKLTPT
jgi:CheY-like chemotaxis protein/two-component sensor histidine kinase